MSRSAPRSRARRSSSLPTVTEDPSPFTTPPRLTQTAPLPAQWRARCSGRTGRRRWYHGVRRSPSSTRAARRAPSCTCPHPTLSPLPLPSNLDHLPAAGCEQDDGDYRGRAGRQAHLRAHPLLPPPTRNPPRPSRFALPPSRSAVLWVAAAPLRRGSELRALPTSFVAERHGRRHHRLHRHHGGPPRPCARDALRCSEPAGCGRCRSLPPAASPLAHLSAAGG